MLDRIGVAPGWHCLDLGCGPRGITDLLSVRVGPAGRVVGFDADAVFLDHARQYANSRGFLNVEFMRGDVFRTGLPAAILFGASALCCEHHWRCEKAAGGVRSSNAP